MQNLDTIFMRIGSVLLGCCFAGAVYAADASKLPEWQALPPPPLLEPHALDSELEPQVTISKKGDLLIEEYRAGGKLYLVKVTPKIGPPYYLLDETGDGDFIRRDGLGGTNLSPPRWVIHRF